MILDNPNVTMRDQMNKANYDDARDYNRLRNNSQYKSVFDNTSKNVEKTLNTIDMVLAIHGIKNIAVGSANYLRANKPYIQANVETVKNNANILNEAISNVNKRPRGMVLGADGGNIDSYIRDVNKEYKELKNVESVVKKGVSKAERLKQNKINGRDFEIESLEVMKAKADNVVEQITVKSKSKTKTRLDAIGKDKDTGEILIEEYKSSQTAPLTKNQEKAYPEIEKDGAIVVGKGKPPFIGGTKIPPTKIKIIRKE